MFHVPEQYRVISGRMGSDTSFGNNGCFVIPAYKNPFPVKSGRDYEIIASDGLGWEHVSVKMVKKGRVLTPSWDEMCNVKGLFWDAEDVVMQLHPPESEYVNNHPNVLHLWRPNNGIGVPVPPSIMVGVKKVGSLP